MKLSDLIDDLAEGEPVGPSWWVVATQEGKAESMMPYGSCEQAFAHAYLTRVISKYDRVAVFHGVPGGSEPVPSWLNVGGRWLTKDEVQAEIELQAPGGVFYPGDAPEGVPTLYWS